MGQILHGSARATEAVRRAIQSGQASIRALASRQSEDGRQVETSDHDGLRADKPEDAVFNRAHHGRSSDHRRLPQAHAAAARCLPLAALIHEMRISRLANVA